MLFGANPGEVKVVFALYSSIGILLLFFILEGQQVIYGNDRLFPGEG